MYRIPSDLDLSPLVGQITTQLLVGQYDLQFTFGLVQFQVQSPVSLRRKGDLFAYWEEGRWPEPGFYEIMNSPVRQWKTVTDRRIVIEFENGIEMHLEDDSDQYECIRIAIAGTPETWII